MSVVTGGQVVWIKWRMWLLAWCHSWWLCECTSFVCLCPCIYIAFASYFTYETIFFLFLNLVGPYFSRVVQANASLQRQNICLATFWGLLGYSEKMRRENMKVKWKDHDQVACPLHGMRMMMMMTRRKMIGVQLCLHLNIWNYALEFYYIMRFSVVEILNYIDLKLELEYSLYMHVRVTNSEGKKQFSMIPFYRIWTFCNCFYLLISILQNGFTGPTFTLSDKVSLNRTLVNSTTH
jgi:hypothetical protein